MYTSINNGEHTRVRLRAPARCYITCSRQLPYHQNDDNDLAFQSLPSRRAATATSNIDITQSTT